MDNHIKISKNKLEINYVTSYIWHSNNFIHLIFTKLLMEKLVPSPCMPSISWLLTIACCHLFIYLINISRFQERWNLSLYTYVPYIHLSFKTPIYSHLYEKVKLWMSFYWCVCLWTCVLYKLSRFNYFNNDEAIVKEVTEPFVQFIECLCIK